MQKFETLKNCDSERTDPKFQSFSMTDFCTLYRKRFVYQRSFAGRFPIEMKRTMCCLQEHPRRSFMWIFQRNVYGNSPHCINNLCLWYENYQLWIFISLINIVHKIYALLLQFRILILTTQLHYIFLLLHLYKCLIVRASIIKHEKVDP